MLLTGERIGERFPGLRWGHGTAVSDRAVIYSPERVVLGDKTRIDDFCLISPSTGSVELGDFVHLGAFVCLYGAGGVRIGDFSGLSCGSVVFSLTDNFDGTSMVGATVDDDLRDVRRAEVVIEPLVQVGARCTLLPGARMGRGSILGANSLLLEGAATEPFSIWAGSPARRVGTRSRRIEELEPEARRRLAAERARRPAT